MNEMQYIKKGQRNILSKKLIETTNECNHLINFHFSKKPFITLKQCVKMYISIYVYMYLWKISN